MKKILAAAVAAALAAVLIVRLSFPPVPTGERRADGLYFGKMTTPQMKRAFKAQGYNMLDVLENAKPAPRLFVDSVPADFNRSKFDDERPALFTEMMLPLILKANKAVLNERAEIERLQSKFDAQTPFSPQEAAWLEDTAKKYDIDFDAQDLALTFRTLLLHVDAVPPSLLLAMAAEDSGFATSRYAREYNAVFHARNWDGGGIEADEKDADGSSWRVNTYPTLYDAVLARIVWLNSGVRFSSFFDDRAIYRQGKGVLYGADATRAFRLFPDRDFKYPDYLKHLILRYGWSPLDRTENPN